MMNFPTLWITTIVFCLAACSKQEPEEPQAAGTDQAAAAAEEMQETQTAANEAIVSHMHKHAARLDDLMLALADGDLEAAGTPAYWLSRHEAAEGIPAELRDYAIGMRKAAHEVEMAEDLETARAAAEEISAQCQACHAAAGVDVQI